MIVVPFRGACGVTRVQGLCHSDMDHERYEVTGHVGARQPGLRAFVRCTRESQDYLG